MIGQLVPHICELRPSCHYRHPASLAACSGPQHHASPSLSCTPVPAELAWLAKVMTRLESCLGGGNRYLRMEDTAGHKKGGTNKAGIELSSPQRGAPCRHAAWCIRPAVCPLRQPKLTSLAQLGGEAVKDQVRVRLADGAHLRGTPYAGPDDMRKELGGWMQAGTLFSASVGKCLSSWPAMWRQRPAVPLPAGPAPASCHQCRGAARC